MSIKSLIINPGSTSTKIGIFEDETLLFDKTLRHSTEEIAQFDSIIDQKDFRRNIILDFLKSENFDVKKVVCFVYLSFREFILRILYRSKNCERPYAEYCDKTRR